MATTMILARHGETDWNREHRLQGWADPPLNDVGRQQAERLAGELIGHAITVVVTSDLRRAADTAGVVAQRLGVGLVVDPALREVDLGSWSGRLRSEIEGTTRPDGETREQLRSRVVAAIARIASTYAGETVLIVSHGGSLRAFEEHVTGDLPRPLANCEHYTVVANGTRFDLLEAQPSAPPGDPEADDAEALTQG